MWSQVIDKKPTKFHCWKWFTKEHTGWLKEKWRNILWTDESKRVFFFPFSGAEGPQIVYQITPNAKFKPRYTVKIVKNDEKGDASHTMVLGLFCHIPGIMDQLECFKILEEIMLTYAEEEMPLQC